MTKQKEKPMPLPDSKRLWTMKEVSELLEVSRRTLQRMIRANKLKSVRLCRSVRIPNEEVVRLVNGE